MYYLLFVFIVFGGMIDFRIDYLNYWDELALLIIVLLWLRKGMLSAVKKNTTIQRLYCVLLFLIVWGLCGNLLFSDFQDSSIAILKDILAFVKFPIAMLLLPQIYSEKEERIHKLCKLCKVAVLITMLFAFVGYYTDIGVYVYEPGRWMKTFEFYYQHTTFFVSAYVCILAVFMCDSIKRNRAYIIYTCILLFLSQRTKAFFVILVVMMIMIIGEQRLKKLFVYISDKLRFKKKYILFAVFIVIFVGWIIGKDKVAEYFGYGLSAARPALYIVGIYLLIDLLPFGSGFGTFASSLSGEYYSNVYDKYGISAVNGLTRDMYAYAGDVFWPYIYGQFGIVGLIGYIAMIFKLFQRQFEKIKRYDTLVAFGLIWIYALFASIAEAYFTNATSIQMAVMLNVFIAANSNKKVKEVLLNEQHKE